MSFANTCNNERLLITGARCLDLELSLTQTKAFSHYLSLLALWGARLNLTAIRKDELVIRLHFLDSLSVVSMLSSAGSLIDIGSGAGFPGIPIKLALPDKAVYLVEPRRKRANFLRHVARELELSGLYVIESRIENLLGEGLPAITETVTRGFSDIGGFLRISGELLTPGGISVLMQGPKGTTLLDGIRSHLPSFGLSAEQVVSFELPLGRDRRTLLTFRKLGGPLT